MGWFSSSPVSSTPSPAVVVTPSSDEACELKPAEKVKPCCVCQEEKASRDKCMLYSQADNPQDDCKSMVSKYKDCMAGYGFKI